MATHQVIVEPSRGLTGQMVFISAAPSADFFAAVLGGALVALGALYFTRHPRLEEPTLLDEVMGTQPGVGGESPRIYSASPAWKTGIVLLAAIFLLGSLAAAWEFGVILDTRETPPGLVLAFFLAMVASGAAFCIVDTLVSKIVLKTDRLEIHELWRVRRIPRADIESQQTLRPPNSPAVLQLRLKAPGRRKIKLPIMWTPDAAWQAWFAPIPDADVEAAKTFEAAIDGNADLGATPAERKQRLAAARSLARNATWANVGLVAWAFLYPRPYELLILVLAALPWLAVWIMARAPGLYTLNAPRGSGRPDLTLLLISPGFLLTVRALQDVQILDWQAALIGAALVALALMGSVLWALPSAREKPGIAALTLALVMAYGYGAVALGNAVLDRSGGASYATTVHGKHIASGRNKTPKLRLGPWGPRTTEDDVTVPWDVYRSASVGQTVCVRLRPGAFGIHWYRLAPCQPT